MVTLAPEDAWARCLSTLKGKLFSQSYDTWLRPLKCRRLDAERVILEAPHSFSVSWIEQHYLKDIRTVIRQLFSVAPEIEFTVNGQAKVEQAGLWDTAPESHVAAPPRTVGHVATTATSGGNGASAAPQFDINADYTFDSLVVGNCNEVAVTAARTVADVPGRTPFNPLLIYGGVGLGKTHVLQAVANRCLERGTTRPLYVTSEQFGRDFVTSLKENQTLQFAKRYRGADVLLIDDVQFFQGKERMQEEFFHTFNTLHIQGKQIILSSDRPPEALGGLQDRLLSRIQWGLVADIQPPDLETRIAICQKKAESGGLELTDGIAEYIANQVSSNIRELEGIVKRVLFLVEKLNAHLTLDVVEQAVRTMRVPAVDQLTIARIQEAVANYYRVPIAALIGRGRRSDLVVRRQMTMYLCKTLTGDSLRAIAAAFGRDHATVFHACQKFEEDLAHDPALLAEVNAVTMALGR